MASQVAANRASVLSYGRSRSVVCAASQHQPNPKPAMTRRIILGAGLATALIALPMLTSSAQAKISVPFGNKSGSADRQGEVRYTDDEWKEKLSPMSYQVLREEATERPFTSPLNSEKRKGTFVCGGCGAPVFASETKYNSGTGWPSFYQALPDAVDEVTDFSIAFYVRTEIRCHRCQGHLGHVFNDGPKPTGLRYCMNGAALNFVPAEGAESQAA